MKVLYNGATLCLVPSSRKSIVLCQGILCKTERYIGLHCLPSRVRNAKGSQRWLYCFLIHDRNNTDNRYLKIILEKQHDTTEVFSAKSYESTFRRMF